MSDSLPVGWAVASLGEVCEEKVGQGPPTDQHVPYIDISSIDRSVKRIGETTPVTAADAPTRARQWVRSNDVLVSMTRPNLNAVAQVGPEFDGAVASTGFDVLRSIGLVPDWIFFRVRSNQFIADMCEDLQGVVYPAIRPHDVRRHRFPLPPLPEQHRIVEAIESYFTRLDDAVATLERVQRNLKRYRASVLKAAVEGRLVPTEAELAGAEGRSYEPASVLLERILAERRRRWEEAELAKLKAKGKVPKDDEWKTKYEERVPPDTTGLPKLPEGWCWTSVDQLATESLIGLVRNREAQHSSGGGCMYVKMDQIDMDGTVSLEGSVRVDGTDDELKRYSLVDGDILFNTRNSVELVGKAGLVRSPRPRTLFNNNIMRIRVTNCVSSSFVAYQMCSVLFRNQIDKVKRATTSVAAIYGRDLFPRAIALPPQGEQERIVDTLDAAFSSVLAMQRMIGSSALRVARLRQSILKWAFEGRLVDQDPTDEPASVLLERIRTERESAASGNGRNRSRRNRGKAVT